jgi:hypothetical protein
MGKKNRLIQQEAVEGAEERGVFDRKIGGRKMRGTTKDTKRRDSQKETK